MAPEPSIRSDLGGRLLERLPVAALRNRWPRARATAERDALLRVAAAVSEADDLDGLIELAAEEALRGVGAASLSINRFESGGERCRVLINVGDLSELEVRLPTGEVYEVDRFAGLRQLARTGHPAFNSVDDPECDPASREYLRSVGKSSDAEVAIVVEGEIWGTIWCAAADGSSFESADVRFLEAVGGQIARAIARVELFSRVSRLAYEDPLTGLANRRALEEQLDRALARHAEGRSAVALLLCDADRLKRINDAHGHASGDAALRNIASALVSAAASIHPGAFVGRLAGDEFCVLVESLTGAGKGGELGEVEEIAVVAQRELADLRPHLTISCGVATATARVATASQLLAAADTAQYAAKRRGGDRICTASQITDAPKQPPIARGGDGRAELAAAAIAEIAEALGEELADAPMLERLERVGATLTEVADLAAFAISLAATGSGHCRELSHGDNRVEHGASIQIIRTWEQLELYELDRYPATARLIEAGCGTFVARIGDEASDPNERALLEREGFEGMVAAAVGGEEGVYLIELFSDSENTDLRSLRPALALAASAAAPPRPTHRVGHLASADGRALDLTIALADRLAGATIPHEVCEAAVREVQRIFDCTIVHLVALNGAQLELRAEAGRTDTPPGWTQSAEAGLIGRCLREGAPVLATDVTREPQYRSTPATHSVRSELAVPIFVGGAPWGVLNLEDDEFGSFGPGDVRLIEAVAAQVGTALTSIHLYEQLDRAYLGTAEALSAALEEKDAYTAAHSRSIADNAVAVGRLLGCRGEELRMLRYAAAFHDIGKLGISPDLLNKPGPLSAEEWEQMTRHTLIGERILKPIEFLAPIRPLVRHAHERWDGGGYPDGLRGGAIPLGARIIFACDAYDAMTSDRSYRDALPVEVAREELRREAGRQFDPLVVDALLMALEGEGSRSNGHRTRYSIHHAGSSSPSPS